MLLQNAPNRLLLYSPAAYSWDSRYFGPARLRDVLGTAVPLWTTGRNGDARRPGLHQQLIQLTRATPVRRSRVVSRLAICALLRLRVALGSIVTQMAPHNTSVRRTPSPRCASAGCSAKSSRRRSTLRKYVAARRKRIVPRKGVRSGNVRAGGTKRSLTSHPSGLWLQQ
jgi:hypothetical protein